MIADGKQVAEIIKSEIANNLKGQTKKVCFISFGDNPASKKFIEMKSKFAEGVGVETYIYEYPELTEEETRNIVKNHADSKFDGIVVQLPLPQKVNAQDILDLVPVEQDIDMLSSISKEKYISGVINKVPPVARAVERILSHYNIVLENKKIVVIGRGKLVGEPVCMWLEKRKTPYDVVDIHTDEVQKIELIKSADVIISGAGSPHMIKREMVKEGVVIIDAGTSESLGKIVGDADPECERVARLITPVPGGVGPVTVASLFLNI